MRSLGSWPAVPLELRARPALGALSGVSGVQLPARGEPLGSGQDQRFVVRPVARAVGAQEDAVGRPVQQGKDSESPAIGKGHILTSINAADVAPSKQIAAALIDEVEAHGEVVRDLSIAAEGDLVRVRRFHLPIDSNLRADRLRIPGSCNRASPGPTAWSVWPGAPWGRVHGRRDELQVSGKGQQAVVSTILTEQQAPRHPLLGIRVAALQGVGNVPEPPGAKIGRERGPEQLGRAPDLR